MKSIITPILQYVITVLAFSGVIVGMISSIIRAKKNALLAKVNRNNAVTAYRASLYSMLLFKLTLERLKGQTDESVLENLEKAEALLPSYDEMLNSELPLIDKFFLTEEAKELIYIKKEEYATTTDSTN